MGCWNHVCMATRMPVVHPEPVVAFWLTKESDDYGFECYDDGYWAPIPVPIYGDYNDYGAVEEFTGEFDSLVIDHLKDKLVVVGDEKRREHRFKGFNPEKPTIEDLFTGDHEGFLAYRHPWDTKRPHRALRHAVIKRSFWDKVLTAHRVTCYHPGGYSSDFRYEMSFADLTANLTEDTKKLKAFLKANNRLLGMMSDDPFRMMPDKPEIAKWLSNSPTNYSGHEFSFFDMMEKLDDATFDRWILEQLKLRWFRQYMSRAHLQWNPITNTSQEFDFPPYELMADYIGEAIEEYKIRCDWDGEIDEED